MKKLKLFISFFVLCILTQSCKTPIENDIENILNRKKELIKEFQDKSVLKGRDKNMIILTIHDRNQTNEFYFMKVGDSLIYKKDNVLGGKNYGDSDIYEKEMVKRGIILISKMDSLNIQEVSSEFQGLGINSMFYLKKGGNLFYVANLENVKNPEWRKFIKQSIKFNNNWYYNKRE